MRDDAGVAPDALYAVAPLDPEGVERAFALVRPVAPHIGLVRWRTFCAHTVSAARDLRLLGARDGSGTLRGVVGTRGIVHLTHGPILFCPLFVVASVLDPAGVADTLLLAIARIAHRRAQAGFLVSTELLDAALAARLSASGAPDADGSVFIATPARFRPAC